MGTQVEGISVNYILWVLLPNERYKLSVIDVWKSPQCSIAELAKKH
jgi:hypothetical protein